MKTIIYIIIALVFASPLFGQKKLIGDWRISSQKQLSLSEDSSFILTKGENIFEGVWEYVDKKKDSDELVLFFSSDSMTYIIEDTKKSEIRLYDPSKEIVMILSRMEEEAADNINDELHESNNQIEPYQGLYKADNFNTGKFVISPGIGIISYLDMLPSELETNVSSYSLLLESSIWNRVGLGLKLGYASWGLQNQLNYDVSLYSVAARITYHPKITRKLDAFAGVAPIIRYGTLVEQNNNEFKWSTDISPVVGIRYFLLDRFALSGEFAYDTSSNVTLGFALLLN